MPILCLWQIAIRKKTDGIDNGICIDTCGNQVFYAYYLSVYVVAPVTLMTDDGWVDGSAMRWLIRKKEVCCNPTPEPPPPGLRPLINKGGLERCGVPG